MTSHVAWKEQIPPKGDPQRWALEAAGWRYAILIGITNPDPEKDEDLSAAVREEDVRKYGHLIKKTDEGVAIWDCEQAVTFVSEVTDASREVSRKWLNHDWYGGGGPSSDSVPMTEEEQNGMDEAYAPCVRDDDELEAIQRAVQFAVAQNYSPCAAACTAWDRIRKFPEFREFPELPPDSFTPMYWEACLKRDREQPNIRYRSWEDLQEA